MRTPKTHCVNGHEYTPENTGSQPSGRKCRTCNRLRARAHYRAAKGITAPDYLVKAEGDYKKKRTARER